MKSPNFLVSVVRSLAGTGVLLLLPLYAQAAPSLQYDSGNPSAEEQYMLELLNAARANPTAEGKRLAAATDAHVLTNYQYYKVNTSALAAAFASYPAKPPVAMNSALMASSRRHSLDLAAHGVQTHTGTDGSTFSGRVAAAGYGDYSELGESVYAYIYGAYFGHVGLLVDWGVAELGHRNNAMNYEGHTHKEVGISIVPTSIKNFGPMVVTQDFGSPASADRAFLVGVVYADRNGNGQYDPGEGLNGVQVMPSAGDYYAVTTAAGGYTIPLPNGSGSLTLTVSGGELGETQTVSVAYANAENVKADFIKGAAPAGGVKQGQDALSLLSDAVPTGGGWNYSPTLGYWNSSFLPVLYHETLGFMHYLDARDGAGGAYLYDFKTGHWRYTSPALYPYLYDFSANAFLYYFKGTAAPRVFANMSNNQFIYE